MEEQRFFEHEGKTYCVWHLPLAAKEDWSNSQLDAFEQLLRRYVDLIGKGEADFHGVVFPGGAYFSDRELFSADFTGSVFAGPALFVSAVFQNGVCFKQSEFRDVAEFGSSTFHEPTADFRSARFLGDASFVGCQFRGRADFRSTTEPSSELGVTQFRGQANFRSAVFQEDTLFGGAQFHGEVSSFESATFLGPVYFGAASFPYANFASTRFDGNVSFISCRFRSAANFAAPSDSSHAKFKTCSWKGAKFNGPVSFENRIFTAAGNFAGVEFVDAPKFHGCVLHEAMNFPGESAFKERSGGMPHRPTARSGLEWRR